MYTVGDMWERGELSIAAEHHITSAIEKMIAVVIPYNKPIDHSDYSVLLMTLNGEDHRIGLQMVNEIFKHYGWRTYYIGSSIPWHSVKTIVNEREIEYIAISITHSQEINSINEFIDFIKSETKVSVIVGGQALMAKPELSNQIHADYISATETEIKNIIKKINSKKQVS